MPQGLVQILSKETASQDNSTTQYELQPRSLLLDVCVKFSRGFPEACLVDEVVDVLVDGAQGLAELGGACGWSAAMRGRSRRLCSLV